MLTIHNNGEKTVKQRLKTLVATGDDLVEHLNLREERVTDSVSLEMVLIRESVAMRR